MEDRWVGPCGVIVVLVMEKYALAGVVLAENEERGDASSRGG